MTPVHSVPYMSALFLKLANHQIRHHAPHIEWAVSLVIACQCGHFRWRNLHIFPSTYLKCSILHSVDIPNWLSTLPFDDSKRHWVKAVLETRLEKLLVRGASKFKKLLALLKSSLSSYFAGVWGQNIKLIMLYFRFRFFQGFVWVCIGEHTHFITPRAALFSDTF